VPVPAASSVKEFELPMMGRWEKKGLCAPGDIKGAYWLRIRKVGSLYA
jgi:hypothetical protein